MSKSNSNNHLIPDAVFCIRFNNRRHFFILEMDRGTVSSSLMLKRYQGYYLWWKQKGPKKDLGISSVRILTVTTGKKRMENMIKACYAVKENGKGSALFWFTLNGYVNIFKPHILLNRIWRKAIPNDFNFYSLLD